MASTQCHCGICDLKRRLLAAERELTALRAEALSVKTSRGVPCIYKRVRKRLYRGRLLQAYYRR